MLAIAAQNLITTFQAIVLGVLQGATELFPVSSLGHTVLFPTLFRWHNIVAWQSQPESPWLAFVVMLHVGSAVGLLIYFWREWVAIIGAFFATLRKRRIETPTERLAWLIICATIPVGILGLLLEHPIRVALAKPLAAAVLPDRQRVHPARRRALSPARRGARAGPPRGPERRGRPSPGHARVSRGGGDRDLPVHGADRRDQPRRRRA